MFVAKPEDARLERRRLLELFGTLDWDESYDYKAERARDAAAHLAAQPAAPAGRDDHSDQQADQGPDADVEQ